MAVNKTAGRIPGGRNGLMALSQASRSRRLTLQPASQTPLYRSVQQKMLQRLSTGEWKPGDRLPNEPDLAEQFGVASLTLRAAIADLVNAGLLHRRPGRGTYVARHEPYGEQMRFSNIYRADDSKASAIREMLALRHQAASAEHVRLLALEKGSRPRVCVVGYLLRAGAQPIASTTVVLPLPLFAGLRKDDLATREENLYSIYQRRCGVTVLRMEECISARCADRTMARRLGLAAGHPLLCVQRIAYTYNNVPVEIRYRTYEGLTHYYRFTHDNL
jgi:GntR family transcriptional regulator